MLDPDLAPVNAHIVHLFTPSLMSEWKDLSPSDYLKKKRFDADRLIERVEKILPGLSQSIIHFEVGTPRSHRRFLGRFQGSYGPVL